MSKKVEKKAPGKKTGEKELRTCAICFRTNKQIKVFHRHHLRYGDDCINEIVRDVCFEHHNQLHGRMTYHNYFEKLYGKDYGPYKYAKSVVRMYEEAFAAKNKTIKEKKNVR